MMKPLLLATALLISSCALSPSRTNPHLDFALTLESQKDHSEGLDITVALSNSSRQTLRLFSKGAATLVLDGKLRVRGRITETVDIEPGDRKTAVLQFRFINRPRIYKKGVLEITPAKAFSTCSEANLDEDVIHDNNKPNESDEDRGLAMEVQPDTCDRQLKHPIELSL